MKLRRDEKTGVIPEILHFPTVQQMSGSPHQTSERHSELNSTQVESSTEDRSEKSQSAACIMQLSRVQSYPHSKSFNSVQQLLDPVQVLASCAANHDVPMPVRTSKQGLSFQTVDDSKKVTVLRDDGPLASHPGPWNQSNFFARNDVTHFSMFDNPSETLECHSLGFCEDLFEVISPQDAYHPKKCEETDPASVGEPHQNTRRSCLQTISKQQNARNFLGASQSVENCLREATNWKRSFSLKEPKRGAAKSSFLCRQLQQNSFEDKTSNYKSLSEHSDILLLPALLENVGNANDTEDTISEQDSQLSVSEALPQVSSQCHVTNSVAPDSNCYFSAAHHKRRGSVQAPRNANHKQQIQQCGPRRNSEPDYANISTIAQFLARIEANIEATGEKHQDSCHLSDTGQLALDISEKGSIATDINSDETTETMSLCSKTACEPWQLNDSVLLNSLPSFETALRILGKSESVVDDGGTVSLPLLPSLFNTDENLASDQAKMKRQGQTAIEQFAVEHFNEHRQGILGKPVPIGNMLTWTKELISKPMIRTIDKVVKKEAPEVFRAIQMFMNDRKTKQSPLQIALEIVQKGWTIVALRDEMYIQLCRQTTNNPKQDSLMLGWELMGVCLSVFPPSIRFHSYLDGFISKHLDTSTDKSRGFISHLASLCKRRLEKTSKRGLKGTLPKINIDFIEQALKSMFHPSNFGSTLEDIIQLQKERFPQRRLPWIQTTLSEELLRLNGPQTEGIFRVPGDSDDVSSLKSVCDQWKMPDKDFEPHVVASLLKQWYRDLYEPLIPSKFYSDCVMNCSNVETVLEIVDRLPSINRLVLTYLIRFLQVFAAAENVNISKMDANNLATIMAPNVLRCESENPSIILRNVRKEASFIRLLILNLDTSFMDGIW